MAFGVTDQGFVRKRLADIKTEMENALRTTLGASINLLPESVFAQLVGLQADREADLWELAEDVYNSQYPDSSEGVSLDNIAAISGLTRLGAKASLLRDVHLFGTSGEVIPAGTVASVAGDSSSRFATLSAVILAVGVNEIQEISFSLTPDSGQFRLSFGGILTDVINFDDSAAEILAILDEHPLLNKLPSLGVTGSFGAGFLVNLGKVDIPLMVSANNTLTNMSNPVTITISQDQAGVPQGTVDCEAEQTGPTSAPAFSLTEIETPVTGLDSVLNIEEAILGRNTETDGDFRVRRIQSLQRAGSATVEAIRARLLEVLDVEQVIVFENVTDLVDGNGLDPHSFKCFVQGGDNQDIGDALWLNKPAGIKTMGDIAVSVTDSQGVVQTVNFSRPDEIEVYITVEITKDTSPTSEWPATGDDLVRTAMADFVNGLRIGQSVIVYPKLIASINSIPGIEDVRIGIDTTPAPPLDDDDNVVISINEVARISDPDTQIVVTVIP